MNSHQNTSKTLFVPAKEVHKHVFSGQLVETHVKDRKTGRFIKGHQKIGGRIKGSLNLNTRLMGSIWKTEGIENQVDQRKLVRGMLRIALEGKSTPSIRMISFILNITEGPLGRMKREWQTRI